MTEIIIAIAMLCGPQSGTTYQREAAESCQKKTMKCVLEHACGKKKCQPDDITLAKCVAGQFDGK